MKNMCAFAAIVFNPSVGACDEAFNYTLTDDYEVSSLLEDRKALVSDGNRQLVCELSDRVDYLEVERCRLILTKHELEEIRADADEVAALERLVNTPDHSREAALLSLFAGSECDAYLGIDSESAVITYIPAEPVQSAEVSPFSDEAAPPLQRSSVSVAEVFARSKAIDLYATELGFSVNDQELLGSRLNHSFEWALNGLVAQSVLAQVVPGHFKIQEDCP